ncbi:MAG TPA: hypothetical protein DDZ53_04110 [Firmicutes bacterium]|nr:hypothetical protein [Bacillota bacterium]
MRLGPLLSIQTTPALLGLNINPGSMRLKQRQADLVLEQPQAVMRVQGPSGQLVIDNTTVHQELGIGSPLVSARQQAVVSVRVAQQGTARRAREGDRMMRQSQVIGTIAKETNYASAHVETNVGLLPRSGPEIAYVGEPNPRIDVVPQAPRLRAKPQGPLIDIGPTVVKAYLQQKGSVEIEYVGPREIWA